MSRPLARAATLRALSHEGVVSRCEQDVVAPDVEGTRDVDSVVAARQERGGEVTGVAGDAFVSRDDSQLRPARQGGCRSVVVENRYVDADYRSDYSAFWSLRVESPPPFARRLHVFSEVVDDDRLHVVNASAGYLGYSVLKPLQSGPVGRTVLAPPPQLANATLALVDDDVSLFGNRLTVRGVPFCQQDGEYLRCAHAAAWICRYIAHRRGLVGRHTTAAIVDHTPSLLSAHRAPPSKGMNLNQLQAGLGAIGQPALFYGLRNMPRVRGVDDPAPQVDPAGDPIEPGFWENADVQRHLPVPELRVPRAHRWPGPRLHTRRLAPRRRRGSIRRLRRPARALRGDRHTVSRAAGTRTPPSWSL